MEFENPIIMLVKAKLEGLSVTFGSVKNSLTISSFPKIG